MSNFVNRQGVVQSVKRPKHGENGGDGVFDNLLVKNNAEICGNTLIKGDLQVDGNIINGSPLDHLTGRSAVQATLVGGQNGTGTGNYNLDFADVDSSFNSTAGITILAQQVTIAETGTYNITFSVPFTLPTPISNIPPPACRVGLSYEFVGVFAPQKIEYFWLDVIDQVVHFTLTDTIQFAGGSQIFFRIMNFGTANVLAGLPPPLSGESTRVDIYETTAQSSGPALPSTGYLPLAGGTMTGSIDMGAQDILNATNLSSVNVTANNLLTGPSTGLKRKAVDSVTLDADGKVQLTIEDGALTSSVGTVLAVEDTKSATDFLTGAAVVKGGVAVSGNMRVKQALTLGDTPVDYQLPTTRGTTGQVIMATDGLGGTAWQDESEVKGFLPLTGGVMTGPIEQADGLAAAPSYSFVAAPDAGMYHTPGVLALAQNGGDAVRVRFDSVTADSTRRVAIDSVEEASGVGSATASLRTLGGITCEKKLNVGGAVTVGASTAVDYVLPTTRGTTGQVIMATDGVGGTAWQDEKSGGGDFVLKTGDTMTGDLVMGVNQVFSQGGFILNETPISFQQTGLKLVLPSTIGVHCNGAVQVDFTQGVTTFKQANRVEIDYVEDASVNGLGALRVRQGGLYVARNLVVKTGVSIGDSGVNYNLPVTRGTAGQVLKTDGTGTVAWEDEAAGIVGSNYRIKRRSAVITVVPSGTLTDIKLETSLDTSGPAFIYNANGTYQTLIAGVYLIVSKVLFANTGVTTPFAAVNYVYQNNDLLDLAQVMVRDNDLHCTVTCYANLAVNDLVRLRVIQTSGGNVNVGSTNAVFGNTLNMVKLA